MYIVENGIHIKEVVIVNISNGFYQVCFTDKRGSIKLRESRLYKTISEAATNNSAAKNKLNKLQKKKTYRSPYDYECGYYWWSKENKDIVYYKKLNMPTW